MTEPANGPHPNPDDEEADHLGMMSPEKIRSLPKEVIFFLRDVLWHIDPPGNGSPDARHMSRLAIQIDFFLQKHHDLLMEDAEKKGSP
jgi:hypothetical protein